MSRTGSSVRSGYCVVMGRRSRYDSVMESPCQNDFTVPVTLSTYSVAGVFCMRFAPLPVGEVEAVALDRLDVEPDAPPEEDRQQGGDGGQRQARGRLQPAHARRGQHPEEREDEAAEAERDEVLPAERHHLV